MLSLPNLGGNYSPVVYSATLITPSESVQGLRCYPYTRTCSKFDIFSASTVHGGGGGCSREGEDAAAAGRKAHLWNAVPLDERQLSLLLIIFPCACAAGLAWAQVNARERRKATGRSLKQHGDNPTRIRAGSCV